MKEYDNKARAVRLRVIEEESKEIYWIPDIIIIQNETKAINDREIKEIIQKIDVKSIKQTILDTNLERKDSQQMLK